MPLASLHRRRSAIAVFCLFWTSLFFAPPVTAQQKAPVILFDEGHGMQFVIDTEGPLHLSQLADLVRQQGAEVVSNKETLSRAVLVDKKGLIISGPFAQFTAGEIDALIDYIIEGGRLAVMLHIPMPAFFLLQRLNVRVSRGVIQEQNNVIDGNSKYFRTAVLFPHRLTRGLRQFAVNGAWALVCSRPNVQVLAETSPGAWIDQNGNNLLDDTDPMLPFAVLVAGRLGKGEYLVFSDDSIFQNRFLAGDNRKLAENLAAWLLQR